MRFGLVVMLFVLSLFAGRLVQLQGLDASVLASEALQQRTASVELPAHRGDITDISGAVLATTVERRNILVDQTIVGNDRRTGSQPRIPDGRDAAAAELAPVLGLSVREVSDKLTGTALGAYLARKVTPEVARKIMRLNLAGVDTEQASRRDYPAGELAGNVLGFVGTDGRVFGGVEAMANSVLKGTRGSITYEHGEDGTRIPTGVADEVEPRDGGTVRLTLDRDLQWKAQQLCAAQIVAVEAESCSIVAVDPHTGDVLALATAPTFDPNKPGADTGNRPLLDVFEPGSTSKVVTLAAALEEKVATPLSRITVPPRLARSDRSFKDAEPHGVEQLTLAGVLAQSSNIGTIIAGEKVPAVTMERYMRLFGLGAKTGVGLPESSGRLNPAAQWNGSQRYTVLFGQGLSVNALQAAQVFATLANDGVRVAPRLVAGQTGADGVFHPAPPGAQTRAVSAQTAQSMREMMEGVVVEGGTAVKAAVPGYRVAGKTGTAERADEACKCYSGYTASFIGMAPADKPDLVIAVIVQKPLQGHYGGEVAAPLFQQMMTYALAHRGIAPTGTQAPQIPSRW